MATRLQHVTARGLTKTFGATFALDGVDLSLRAGCITAIEGGNGSGKTTLLSIVAQLMRPSSGALRYGGHEPARWGAALRRRIGLVHHQALVYPDLTARENLGLFGKLYDLEQADTRANDLMERLGMKGYADFPCRRYSRGQLQRLAVARALMHRPELLLLDEPTTGLDRQGVGILQRVLIEERDRGAIVMLITHDERLAAQLGDERFLLERGRLRPADASSDASEQAS